MWLTSTAIRRPVFIAMFVLALIVMGVQSRSKMPKERMPNIDIPVITVITTYAGAGPSEIETLVSEPIEKACTSIGNLTSVSSTSQTGVSSVVLEFEVGTDVESVAADVRDKVSAIKSSLPDDADDPQVNKLDTSSQAVMTIGLAGNLTPKEMRILADDTVADQLAKVGGVASVNVSGGEEREISVSVNKDRLDAYGIGIQAVVDAIKDAGKNVPAGSIKENKRDYSVRTVGEFTSAQQVADAPITLTDASDGSKNVIHVHDIATVKDTVVEPEKIVRLNGESSVVFTIQKQSGSNTVAIADGIKKQLAAMQSTLPAGVTPVIATDQSVQVRNSLDAVNKSLMEGILLVVVIVFLFLHTARATFIVALAIPTSLMATYIPTGAMGFTQNQMLLMALSLVVGILVDDSIVVLENIERHLRMRENPEEAAINGRSEIGMAAIAITMVDIVVFLPIAFMGGMMGLFFRQFGVTVAVATAFSLLMSFTLTPMLASKWMKSEADKDRDDEMMRLRREQGRMTVKDRIDTVAGALFGAIEKFLRRLDTQYRGVLEWALENRFLTVIIGFVSLIAVFAMIMPLPHGFAPKNPRIMIALICLLLAGVSMAVNRKSKFVAVSFGIAMAIIALTVYLPFGFEFFPQSDAGQFAITVRTPAGTSLAVTDKIVKRIEKEVLALPEMKTVRYWKSESEWYLPWTWGKGHRETDTGYCMTTVGASGSGMMGSGDSGSQYASLSVQVVDKERRKRSLQAIMDYMSARVAHIPGTDLVTIAASSSDAPSGGITKYILGQNMDDLLTEANRVAAVMKKVPGTQDVDISYKPSSPERRIVVDKYKAAKLGLTLKTIANACRTAVDGDTTTKLRDSGTEYDVRVHYAKADRSYATDVENLIVGSRNGAPIYLRDVAKVIYDNAPNKIERENRQRKIAVTANIASGYQMGNVNQSIDAALKSTSHIPGTSIQAGGSTKRMAESFVSLLAALALAIVLVYMLMGALFESFLTPFVIMFSLPQAMVGALLALLLTGKSMGITAMIGIIMLMGLVSKNAILLIDYTNTLMSRGRRRNEALLEAGPTRLRPIMMTTLAMVGGMMPTALAMTQGSETRSPMAISVIGGLILSTLLTLIVIPVVFTLVDDAWKWFLRSFFPNAYRKAMDKERLIEREPVASDIESVTADV